jgi:hypothetical protein
MQDLGLRQGIPHLSRFVMLVVLPTSASRRPCDAFQSPPLSQARQRTTITANHSSTSTISSLKEISRRLYHLVMTRRFMSMALRLLTLVLTRPSAYDLDQFIILQSFPRVTIARPARPQSRLARWLVLLSWPGKLRASFRWPSWRSRFTFSTIFARQQS